MSILCTLHIPLSLTRHRPQRLTNTNPANVSKSATSGPPQAPYTPDLALPQQNMFNDGVGSDAGTVVGEEYREMKCAFSVTIRRDAWGVPVAIMGQWIVSRHLSANVQKVKIGLTGWMILKAYTIDSFLYLSTCRSCTFNLSGFSCFQFFSLHSSLHSSLSTQSKHINFV